MGYTYKTINMLDREAIRLHNKGYKIISHSPFSDMITFEIPTQPKMKKTFTYPTKSQDATALNLFKAGMELSRNYDPITGILKVVITFKSGESYDYKIDRKGRIVK